MLSEQHIQTCLSAAVDEHMYLQTCSKAYTDDTVTNATITCLHARHKPDSIATQLQLHCHDMQAVGGIIPALQKLSYAGKNFEDSQRSLQQ